MIKLFYCTVLSFLSFFLLIVPNTSHAFLNFESCQFYDIYRSHFLQAQIGDCDWYEDFSYQPPPHLYRQCVAVPAKTFLEIARQGCQDALAPMVIQSYQALLVRYTTDLFTKLQRSTESEELLSEDLLKEIRDYALTSKIWTDAIAAATIRNHQDQEIFKKHSIALWSQTVQFLRIQYAQKPVIKSELISEIIKILSDAVYTLEERIHPQHMVSTQTNIRQTLQDIASQWQIPVEQSAQTYLQLIQSAPIENPASFFLDEFVPRIQFVELAKLLEKHVITETEFASFLTQLYLSPSGLNRFLDLANQGYGQLADLLSHFLREKQQPEIPSSGSSSSGQVLSNPESSPELFNEVFQKIRALESVSASLKIDRGINYDSFRAKESKKFQNELWNLIWNKLDQELVRVNAKRTMTTRESLQGSNTSKESFDDALLVLSKFLDALGNSKVQSDFYFQILGQVVSYFYEKFLLYSEIHDIHHIFQIRDQFGSTSNLTHDVAAVFSILNDLTQAQPQLNHQLLNRIHYPGTRLFLESLFKASTRNLELLTYHLNREISGSNPHQSIVRIPDFSLPSFASQYVYFLKDVAQRYSTYQQNSVFSLNNLTQLPFALTTDHIRTIVSDVASRADRLDSKVIQFNQIETSLTDRALQSSEQERAKERLELDYNFELQNALDTFRELQAQKALLRSRRGAKEQRLSQGLRFLSSDRVNKIDQFEKIEQKRFQVAGSDSRWNDEDSRQSLELVDQISIPQAGPLTVHAGELLTLKVTGKWAPGKAIGIEGAEIGPEGFMQVRNNGQNQVISMEDYLTKRDHWDEEAKKEKSRSKGFLTSSSKQKVNSHTLLDSDFINNQISEQNQNSFSSQELTSTSHRDTSVSSSSRTDSDQAHRTYSSSESYQDSHEQSMSHSTHRSASHSESKRHSDDIVDDQRKGRSWGTSSGFSFGIPNTGITHSEGTSSSVSRTEKGKVISDSNTTVNETSQNTSDSTSISDTNRYLTDRSTQISEGSSTQIQRLKSNETETSHSSQTLKSEEQRKIKSTDRTKGQSHSTTDELASIEEETEAEQTNHADQQSLSTISGKQYALGTQVSKNRSLELRIQASFELGIHSPKAPFPEYPVGSLLLFELPQGETRLSRVRNVEVVRNGLSRIAPSHSDYYFIVNDIGGIQNPKLTVEYTVEKPFGDEIQEILSNLERVMRLISDKGLSYVHTGSVTSEQLQELKMKANSEFATIGYSPHQLPLFGDVYGYWLQEELNQVQLKAAILQHQRKLYALLKEIHQIAGDHKSLEKNQEITHFSYQLSKNNAALVMLADEVKNAVRFLKNAFVPVAQVRYPSLLRKERKLILNGASFGSKVNELASGLKEVLSRVNEDLSNEKITTQTKQEYVILHLPIPAQFQGKNEKSESPLEKLRYPQASSSSALSAWSALNSAMNYDPNTFNSLDESEKQQLMDSMIASITIQPKEIISGLNPNKTTGYRFKHSSAHGMLPKNANAPIIRSMGIFFQIPLNLQQSSVEALNRRTYKMDTRIASHSIFLDAQSYERNPVLNIPDNLESFGIPIIFGNQDSPQSFLHLLGMNFEKYEAGEGISPFSTFEIDFNSIDFNARGFRNLKNNVSEMMLIFLVDYQVGMKTDPSY